MNTIRPNTLAIIKKNGKLLVQKGTESTTGEIFYRLLGGGIEFGEPSSFALKREFMEELAVEIYNEKLLTVIENIFDYNGTKQHEITFLYESYLKNEEIYNTSYLKIVDKSNKNAEWVNIQQIKKGEIILYPEEAIKFL